MPAKHDPLCFNAGHEILGESCWACDYIEAGRRDAAEREYRRGYTAGYNDRARSAVHTYQMYGIPEFNQHGGGVNP